MLALKTFCWRISSYKNITSVEKDYFWAFSKPPVEVHACEARPFLMHLEFKFEISPVFSSWRIENCRKENEICDRSFTKKTILRYEFIFRADRSIQQKLLKLA